MTLRRIKPAQPIGRLFAFIVCAGLLLGAWSLVAPIERLLAMRRHPLVYAVYLNDTSTVQRLFDSGVDPNAEFEDPAWEDVHRTPLLIACERGNARMVRLLLDHGALDYRDG